MLQRTGHAETLLSTIANSVKTNPLNTTRDTVVQFLCEDGQVVTSDRSLLQCFSPLLRSVICSAPFSSPVIISLPDASSSGVEGVLNMIGQEWTEDVYVLNEGYLAVLSSLGIPVGDKVEKVQVVDFDANDVVAVNELKLADDDFQHIGQVKSSSLKCPYCDMDYGALNEDAKEELSIHIGEIHSEPELMAEFSRTFPSSSNECEDCGAKVGGEYVQKEHILLQHPWPMLKATVEEVCAGISEEVEKEKNKEKDIDNDKHETRSPKIPKLSNQVVKGNNKLLSDDHIKADKIKRGRKRKSDQVISDTPLIFPYVPQRKSAKKASLHISKAFEGGKKYKQQNIGIFVKKVGKPKEFMVENRQGRKSMMNDTRELMEDIDMLLKDSDDEDDNLGLDITYENSDIGDIQDHIEFSDSEGEENYNDALNYSIKVENKSLIEQENNKEDLLEIQHGIAFSDSDEE